MGAEVIEDQPCIVLAGGRSTRIGGVGEFLPKSVFPVSGTDTLLTRNLRWLLRAGYRRIFVSTSPDLHDILTHVTLAFTRVERVPDVTVLANPSHALGPVHALAAAVNMAAASAKSVLYCLADVYFLADPFSGVTGSPQREDVVFTHRVETDEHLRRGGIVLVDEGECRRFYVRAEDCTPDLGHAIRIWSGMAVLGGRILKELQSYVVQRRDGVEEDFLNACLSEGCRIEETIVPDFVNVNTFRDYQTAMALAAVDNGQAIVRQ